MVLPGAVLWSGVRELVLAGEGPELEELTGFDEGVVAPDWEVCALLLRFQAYN